MATKKRRKAPASKKKSRGRRGKSNVITVDFTDVEAGGGMPTPDGYYVAEIMSADLSERREPEVRRSPEALCWRGRRSRLARHPWSIVGWQLAEPTSLHRR